MRYAAAWDEEKYRRFVDEFWAAAKAEPWLHLTTHTAHPVDGKPAVELHVREDEPQGKAALAAFKRVFGTVWRE